MTLLPCPFCGSAASSVQYGAAVFRIKCTDPGCDARGGKGATSEEAAAKWNRRASYAAHLPAVMAATEPVELERPLVTADAAEERSCFTCAHDYLDPARAFHFCRYDPIEDALDYMADSGAETSPDGLPTDRDMRCPSWTAKGTT